MKETLSRQIYQLQENRDRLVAGDKQIVNIGFSTRKQLLGILSQDDKEEPRKTYIMNDSLSDDAGVEFAQKAMSILNNLHIDTFLVLPNCNLDTISQLPDIENITDLDFQNLFRQYSDVPYVNYKLIIQQAGELEAYKQIARALATKQYVNNNIKDGVIVTPSNVNGLNSIYNKGPVENRVDRNNLFVRVDYNK